MIRAVHGGWRTKAYSLGLQVKISELLLARSKKALLIAAWHVVVFM
jgi:hypothetical protein